MFAIKDRDTKPKIFFRKALWKWGIRYRKNVKLFGKPDIVIKKYKLVVLLMVIIGTVIIGELGVSFS
jgi:DNA mismatch endonuclease (patch repair protein)